MNVRTVLTLMFATVALASCGVGSSSASTRAPIRLMVEGIETPAAALGGVAFPWAATGVQAAAAGIDATGGINGRKVVIDVCDNKGDPNQSAACARLAKTKGDIAVVGTFDPNAARVVPILQAEKIPYIGGIPTTPTEFSSSVSFQFDPGPVLSSTAVTALWKSTGCKSVVSILPANAENNEISAVQKAVAAKEGISVNVVLYPITITDVTPTLSAALASNPNCINYDGVGSIGVRFIAAARQQGFTGKIISSVGDLSPQYLQALGATGNGILVLSSADAPQANGSNVAQFNKNMASYLKHKPAQIAMNSNEFAQAGWSSVQLVKQALKGAKTISSAYLLKKIPTMCNVDLGNFYPHVDFCKSQTKSKLLPRVYNDAWQYFVAKNGNYVPTNGKWYQLSSTIPAGG